MVENGDRNRLVADLAAQIAPAAARAPGRVSLLAFAGEIDAVYAGVVELSDGGRAAIAVGEDFWLVGRSLQRASEAHAEHAFLVVMEDDCFVERLQRGNAVDAAEIGATTKDEASVFIQNELLLAADPVGVDFQLRLIGAALCQRDSAMADYAHLRGIFHLNCFRVVPEIEAADVAVVEPQASVMRMIDTLTRARLKRETAGDDRAFGGAKRIKHGLGKPFGPNVGGEGPAVDDDVDASFGFIWDHAIAVLWRVLVCRDAAEECGAGGNCGEGFLCRHKRSLLIGRKG